MKGVADIETSLEKAKPELRVRVDRERASDLGVPAGVIGTTLRAAVAGEVASVIEDREGDSYDVRVRLRADQRRYAEDLLALTVPTDKDDDNKDKLLVPLRELAHGRAGHRAPRRSATRTWCARCASPPTPTAARSARSAPTSRPRSRGST